MTPAIEPPAIHEQIQVPSHDTQFAHEYNNFKNTYPAFAATAYIDALREKDYKRLDQLKQVYLDFTGSSLYADSQIQGHMTMLMHDVYGNPHSDNPTSLVCTQLSDQARCSILEYFNASPDEYTVIFTLNATGALKLVGESYPFQPHSMFLLTYDCHNSVSGIREFASRKGARTSYIPLKKSNLRLNQDTLDEYLAMAKPGVPNLFAFPAESNFSGVQHPLEWINRAHAKGWDVLLDAAAFVPTNKLDLSQWHPEFVDISFYKMFGYPTGVGCLIVKHTALAQLKRPWFAGGTVEVVGVAGNGYSLHEGYAGHEDGSINFLSISAIPLGIRHLQETKVEIIHERVAILTDWLLKQLRSLRHSNGMPLVQIYGPHKLRMRGGIIAMNFNDQDGVTIDPGIIEHYAALSRISVRTGCFCNPGSVETINGITREEVEMFFNGSQPKDYEDFIVAMKGKQIGAVRVSLGIVSNFADVYQFVQFAKTFIDKDITASDRSRCAAHRACYSSC
jgi:selenocysteine lyase/cysteine desulfurase